MLRINKSYNTISTMAYFDKALINEGEYYTEDNITTFWQGQIAKRLGLEGKKVTREDFRDLISNVNPNTKERLTVRNAERRRAGFDLTFNAPKSISVLHAITKNDDILKAHQLAYQKTMATIEANMQTQANTKDGRFFEDSGSITYIAFNHYTSRSNEITKNGKTHYESDPHLHSHLFVPNVTWSKKNNRFQALEIGNVHKLANWYENSYHSYLSFELNKLGFQIRRTNDRYEIASVPQSVINKFSNRTKTINKIAKEKSITDPKKKSELGAKTRHSKSKGVSENELYALWKDRLTNAEYKALLNAKKHYQELPPRISVKEAIDKSIAHLLERQSAAPEQRILAHALSLGYGHLRPDDVITELNSRDNIIRSKIDTVSYATTRELVREENKLISLVTQCKGNKAALNTNYQIKQDFLNEEQRKAVHTLLNSQDFVTVLKGGAGTGKTSLLSEVKKGIEERGKPLFSVAPSTQATQVLQQKGFDASTIASLILKPELKNKLKNGVLFVDEAGMVGIEQMTQLLSIAKTQNCRVKLIGDIAQHNSPSRGDALRIIQNKAQPTTAHVQEIVRQKPVEYRNAVAQLSKGNTAQGFKALENLNAIKEIPEYEERMQKIASDYADSISKKRTALIISPTNNESELLSQIVREELKKRKVVTGKEHSFETLKPLSLTEAQKQDVINYQTGNVIRFTKNQKNGFKAGSHHEVLPIEKPNEIKVRDLKTNVIKTLPYKTPEHFQLYSKTQTTIAKGDTIRLSSNTKTIEQTKIANGTRHSVTGFNKTGDIKLSNGKTLAKDSYHFKQGYVLSSHASQGADSKDVFIAQSDLSFSASSKEQFYVSVSRGTQSVKIYTSDKDELRRNILRSSERISAQTVAEGQQRNLLNQKQRNHHRSLNEKLREHGRTRQQQKSATRDISTSRRFKSDR